MLDGINAKLIDVCWEFLETHSLNLDKYQLATIIMDLYTQTISQLEFPFKVIAKENKTLIQEYLQKNRAKIETLERIEKENIALDKEIELQKNTAKLLRKKQTEAEQEIDDIKDSANLWPKPEMPSKKSGTGGLGSEPPIKKKRYNWNTDSLAISWFTLPSF